MSNVQRPMSNVQSLMPIKTMSAEYQGCAGPRTQGVALDFGHETLDYYFPPVMSLALNFAAGGVGALVNETYCMRRSASKPSST